LADLPGVILPFTESELAAARPVRLPVLVEPQRRHDFVEHLRQSGIWAGVWAAPLPVQWARDCPNARSVIERLVALPVSGRLTAAERRRLRPALRGFFTS
jgi:dTDP-4-amino-4,6-dideoxygalactose transaminase